MGVIFYTNDFMKHRHLSHQAMDVLLHYNYCPVFFFPLICPFLTTGDSMQERILISTQTLEEPFFHLGDPLKTLALQLVGQHNLDLPVTKKTVFILFTK